MYSRLVMRRAGALLLGECSAYAKIEGDISHRELNGLAAFFTLDNGVLVVTEVRGLPTFETQCERGIFAMHIHGGGSCTGPSDDPFKDARMHYNPSDCRHPNHAGDLPALFSNDGFAFSAVYTERFTVSEIIGRTVVIHAAPDDFMSDPSGNSGARIGCGVIWRG